jgi:predicted phage terminase large subunit-like protein
MKDIKYIGYRLHKRGFKVWFKYMFRAVEKMSFLEDPMHEYLYNVYQDIFDKKTRRQIINIAPRSAKSTMCIYFIAYAYAVNPHCNFIYTSYSADLLSDLSRRLQSILESTQYKAMYSFDALDIEYVPDKFDEFWTQIYNEDKENVNTNKYSAKKITTSQGGVTLFSSMGGTITGMGAGLVNEGDKFAGMLIIDDPDKTQNLKSSVFRDKVHTYFSQTLLSRLNNKKKTPILNIQQRLHTEDFTGFLLKVYGNIENKFQLLKIPLIQNDVCLLPSQYGQAELQEVMVDNFTFQSQYQQEPILDGGNIIKKDWFRYYDSLDNEKMRSVFITADTASKTQEHNDFSVFCIWAVNNDNCIFLLDMIRGKWEAPELKEKAAAFYNKWNKVYFKNPQGALNQRVNSFFIEDKASGTGLIQDLSRSTIPVSGVQVSKDKLQRLQDVLTYIAEGRVYLPKYNSQHLVEPFLNECIEFARDNSHKHDDIIDCLTMALKKAFIEGTYIDYKKINERMDQLNYGYS